MAYRWETLSELAAERVFGIIRTDDAASAVRVADTLVDAGLRVVELTLTIPGGLEALEDIAGRHDGCLVGAGTVLDAASARLAILSGARFLVAPGLVPDVVRMGHRYGVPVVPGAQTMTEIAAALADGADAVKVFPAASLGPDWLRGVRAVYPQAPLVPTGGVTVETAPQWLEAGAIAVGVGGALTTGDTDQVRATAAALLQAVRP